MFYHSHMSFQKGDGLFGPYIVRRPAGTDPNDHLYDYDLTEHLIFPQEWFHKVLHKIVFQNKNVWTDRNNKYERPKSKEAVNRA